MKKNSENLNNLQDNSRFLSFIELIKNFIYNYFGLNINNEYMKQKAAVINDLSSAFKDIAKPQNPGDQQPQALNKPLGENLFERE